MKALDRQTLSAPLLVPLLAEADDMDQGSVAQLRKGDKGP
jgi:hypothetical protein